MENLLWAAGQAPDLTLTLEPLNPDDMPGYFLNDFDQAGRIVDDLGLPQVGIQFDLWHAARIHGDAQAVWAKHGPRVNHVQIAGFPSRNEPGEALVVLTEIRPRKPVLLASFKWAKYVPAEVGRLVQASLNDAKRRVLLPGL